MRETILAAATTSPAVTYAAAKVFWAAVFMVVGFIILWISKRSYSPLAPLGSVLGFLLWAAGLLGVIVYAPIAFK